MCLLTLLAAVLVLDLQHFSLEIAFTLPAQLLRFLVSSLSSSARSKHGCSCFVQPAAVSHGAAIPALLPPAGWHSSSALQVFPAKAMEIWLQPEQEEALLAQLSANYCQDLWI